MNYQNVTIYKTLNTINHELYVGSTICAICRRMVQHKERARHFKKTSPLNILMRELGVEHLYIELLEPCPCNPKEELRVVEGKHIRAIGTLHNRIVGRTKKEYHEEHKEDNS